MKILFLVTLISLTSLGAVGASDRQAFQSVPALRFAQADMTMPDESQPDQESSTQNPCLTDPDSPACSTYQTLEQLLRERQERQQQALNELVQTFPEKFGYNPKDYTLNTLIAGSNITIFDKSDWVIFRVQPEVGTIQVGHRAITRDAFWGTMVQHDHQMLSVTFTLDDDACQVVSDGSHCTFTGTDTINLNHNFLGNHQIIKHGQWQINYVESGEEKGVTLRVSADAMPEGAEQVDVEEHNYQYCRLLPNSLDCLP